MQCAESLFYVVPLGLTFRNIILQDSLEMHTSKAFCHSVIFNYVC